MAPLSLTDAFLLPLRLSSQNQPSWHDVGEILSFLQLSPNQAASGKMSLTHAIKAHPEDNYLKLVVGAM